MNAYETFANELEDLRAGHTCMQDIWNRYGSEAEPWMHDFTTILAFVEHYVTDDDIRATDSVYRLMQEEEFARLVSFLRKGKIDQAKRITFLGYAK